MLNSALHDAPLETEDLLDFETLLDDECRAAMALLRLVMAAALGMGLLGLVVRLLPGA